MCGGVDFFYTREAPIIKKELWREEKRKRVIRFGLVWFGLVGFG